VICEKLNIYCINRIEYPSVLCQEIWPAAHFFHNFPLETGCISFEVSYSVYQFIGDKNDSNSTTEWWQGYNLHQTAIMKVSNNKPFVFRYKLHNTISIPKQFITNMYRRGNALPKAYRFWRFQASKSVGVSKRQNLFWRFQASKSVPCCRQQVFPAKHNSSSQPRPLTPESQYLLQNEMMQWLVPPSSLPSATILYGECRMRMHSAC